MKIDKTGARSRRAVMALAAAALGVVLGGCSQGIVKAQAKAKAGDIVGAQDLITKYAQKNTKSEHRVIAYLEKGSIFHMAGDYKGSNDAFEIAEGMMEKIDGDPKYSFSRELKAALTNPMEITYRGTPYDRVMSSVYRGINHGLLGEFDAARPAFTKADKMQEAAIAAREKQIAEAEKEGSKYNSSRDKVGGNYRGLDQFSAYEGFTNPFADAMRGAFMLGQFKNSEDANQARFHFRRALGVEGSNSYLAADLALSESGLTGAPNRTYVFFATGFGPFLEEAKFNFVYATPSGPRNLAAAFPVLKTEPGFVQSLSINAGGQQMTAERVSDMDRIVGADFKAELPLILTRHIASVVAKEVASVGANQAAKQADNAWVQIIVGLGSIIYKSAQNQADIRIWSTLPKQFHYASFETPAEGSITVSGPGAGAQSVQVDPEGVNIVLVRATTPGAPLQVRNFRVE